MSEAVPIAPTSEFVLRKCWGKQQFNLRSEAARAAQRINKSPNRRRPVKSYFCDCCSLFHIGGGHRKD